MGGAEGPAAKDPIPQRPHLFQQYPQHLCRANQHVGARVTVSGKRPSSDAAEPPLEIPPHGLGLVGCGDSGDGSGGTASGVDSLSSTPESSWDAELVGDFGRLPMGDVVVEVSRKECDLEGRPITRIGNSLTPITASSPDVRESHIEFTGLEKTGHDLRGLRVTAIFGVDAVHQIACVTSPIEVGPDGRAYSRVFYPGMQEIWPELYNTSNIRLVEVDVAIEILSDTCGEFRFVGPHLKVAYRRAIPPVDDGGDVSPRPTGRQTARRVAVLVATGGRPLQALPRQVLPARPRAVDHSWPVADRCVDMQQQQAFYMGGEAAAHQLQQQQQQQQQQRWDMLQ
ncbi:expressed unknown protein [Ectocarpus siliculosus]|uniref:Uncharacterized protein n=1 Tax=Ectocarpus siliculosus TaxID=2880 RepID=D7G7N5_ECTSI|nr:expressed unknown protein [Ectocarpus siliculosus]|eukprot:CBJ27774.1 expressed unknown protein [Ectocarpus siliculosus]